FLETKLIAAKFRHDAQYAYGFSCHFGTDSIAGKNCDLEFHALKTRFKKLTHEHGGCLPTRRSFEPAPGGWQQRDQILVVNMFLAVGQSGKGGINSIQLRGGELIAEFLIPSG